MRSVLVLAMGVCRLSLPADEVEMEFIPLHPDNMAAVSAPAPLDGCLLRGLQLEGAAWAYPDMPADGRATEEADQQRLLGSGGSLCECSPLQSHVPMPVMWLRPKRKSQQRLKSGELRAGGEKEGRVK